MISEPTLVDELIEIACDAPTLEEWAEHAMSLLRRVSDGALQFDDVGPLPSGQVRRGEGAGTRQVLSIYRQLLGGDRAADVSLMNAGVSLSPGEQTFSVSFDEGAVVATAHELGVMVLAGVASLAWPQFRSVIGVDRAGALRRLIPVRLSERHTGKAEFARRLRLQDARDLLERGFRTRSMESLLGFGALPAWVSPNLSIGDAAATKTMARLFGLNHRGEAATGIRESDEVVGVFLSREFMGVCTFDEAGLLVLAAAVAHEFRSFLRPELLVLQCVIPASEETLLEALRGSGNLLSASVAEDALRATERMYYGRLRRVQEPSSLASGSGVSNVVVVTFHLRRPDAGFEEGKPRIDRYDAFGRLVSNLRRMEVSPVLEGQTLQGHYYKK